MGNNFNFLDPKYSEYKDLIDKWVNDGIPWNEIKKVRSESPESAKSFLNTYSNDPISLEEWEELVDKLQLCYSNSSNLTFVAMPNKGVNNLQTINSPFSLWNAYIEELSHRFQRKDVKKIRGNVEGLLKYLSLKTQPGKPRKGIAVGNVQSGKTSNYEGLMCLAAQYGWNFFIVLTGTIESLRRQTLDRLKKDLDFQGTTMHFEPIERPVDRKLSSLKLEPTSNTRYYFICLKNSSRLKHLLNWLNSDPNKENINLLFIDDEADQAGINTRSIGKGRTAINRLISSIIFDLDYKQNKAQYTFKSVNYIGFTATPYANFLNEGPETSMNKYSLFPNDFVASLPNSNEYFGPSQLFGTEDREGLDVINNIPIKDVGEISDINKGKPLSAPDSFKKAFLWFYCCVGCARYWENLPESNYQYKFKPLTFLINTSLRTDAHENWRSVLLNLYKSFKDSTSFLEECEKVYDEQTSKFTYEDLSANYPEYSGKFVQNYPKFDLIFPFIKELFELNISPLKVDTNNSFKTTYGKGVILSIDNGKHNGLTPKGEEFRIEYPSDSNHLGVSTAFIVIGGQTISRGLTLQGLVSTYMGRVIKQGDTLMQAARWFGYRPGYELLPRIWLSEDLKEKYTFLSKIDYDLRNYIFEFSAANKQPNYYGIKVESTPWPNWMRITSKNKMKSAIKVSIDYTGIRKQTIKFFNDKEKLDKNLDLTNKFVKELQKNNLETIGQTAEHPQFVWKNAPFDIVLRYINDLYLPDDLSFVDRKLFSQWFNEEYKKGKIQNWDVILSNINDKFAPVGNIGGIEIHKINRSRDISGDDNSVINLKVLRNNKDLIADMPNSGELAQKSGKGFIDSLIDKRFEINMLHVPQLIIYLVNKDSKADVSRNKNRGDLKAPQDLIGLAINTFDKPDKEDINPVYLSIDLSEYKRENNIDDEDDCEND